MKKLLCKFGFHEWSDWVTYFIQRRIQDPKDCRNMIYIEDIPDCQRRKCNKCQLYIRRVCG